MSRSVRLGLATLTVTLLVLPLTLSKPGLPLNLKADEGAYYLMALSLARDFDLRLEAEDRERLFQSAIGYAEKGFPITLKIRSTAGVDKYTVVRGGSAQFSHDASFAVYLIQPLPDLCKLQ